ncbi:MAG TPA: hypothetical protein VF116_03900 [Ktedonobacterales bacterium]
MTGTATPLRFRPTVVVCLGDAGREVGTQLLPLLRSLDPARRAGVAVLAVRDEASGALAGDWLDALDGFEAPDGDGTPGVDLEALVVEAFRGQEPGRVQDGERRHGVLEDPVIWRIQDDGASVPRPLAVVWIAAAADAPELASAVAAVRRAAATEHVDCWVLLVLANVYPQDAAAHAEQAARCADQPWRELLVGDDGTPPPATYTYLFESHGEHGTFWERPGDVAYAAAEAIFVLTATGITTTRAYEETLRRSTPGMVREATERIAGTGASRLTFPRGPAEQYCASVLGAAVLRAWEPPDLDDESYAAEREAETLGWLAGVTRMTRPDPARRRGGRASPRLSALGVRDALGLARPDPDGGLMFAHLRTEHLERLTAGRPERLPAVADEQYAVAQRGYTTWQEAIRPRWERFEVEVERDLIAEVDDLALSGASGLSRALGYVRALHAVMDDERTRQQAADTRRRAAYDRFLDDLAAQGSYAPTRQQAEANGQALARAAATTSLTNPLEARENDVARGLAARYLEALARVPPPLAIAGAVLAMVPPAVFVTQSLFVGVSPVLLTVLLALIFGLLGAGLVLLRRHAVTRAADDLRALYRRRLAARCEEHEHLRRLALIAALRYRVAAMLARLEAWERFVGDLAGELERDAALVEHALFEGPAGRRDLFIANRQRLRRDGYTLRAFERDVSRERALTPRDDAQWHRSDELVLRRLLAALRGHVDVVSGDLGALKRPVRDFCLGVVQPYLRGELVSLAAALDAMSGDSASGLVDTLVERAAILYRPLDPPRPASVFTASRDDLRPLVAQAGRARGALAVEIPDDEWLAVLRLAPGGTLPSFWPLPRPSSIAARPASPASPRQTAPRQSQGRGG